MSNFDALSQAYADVEATFRDRILSGAEKHVEAQVELLKSADARATGLLAACAALAAAGVAFAAANIKPAEPVFWSAIAFTISSLMATASAVWAVWPCQIRLPGWEPRIFYNDIKAGRSTAIMEGESVALLQIRIDKNDRILLHLGWRARISYALVFSIPFYTTSGWLLSKPPHGAGVLLFIIISFSIIHVFLERNRAIKAYGEKFRP